MHRKVAVAIAAALALVIASCGGSETALDRAALVRRVAVACRAAQGAARRQAGATRSADPMVVLRAGQRVLVEKLEGLDAAGDAKEDFDTYKEGLRARLAAIEKVASASRAERQRVLRSVQDEVTAAMRRAEAAASRLGLGTCI